MSIITAVLANDLCGVYPKNFGDGSVQVVSTNTFVIIGKKIDG